MQGEQRIWWFTTVRLATTVIVGVFCGWIFGNAWAGLAVALLGHLAWQLVNLSRLDWWVRHRSFADPPEFGGVWGEVVTQVVRLHRRKRYHKQRFVKLVRQIQRSTAALPDGVVILNSQREISWFNRTAGKLLNLRGSDDYGLRIDNLLRQPQFARYVEARRLRERDRAPARHGAGQLPVAAARAVRRRAAHAARARCIAADAPREHAQGFRRQRLARAAFAAVGDCGVSRDAGTRSGAS